MIHEGLASWGTAIVFFFDRISLLKGTGKSSESIDNGLTFLLFSTRVLILRQMADITKIVVQNKDCILNEIYPD